ncbi:hypothetical protein Pint_10853 [Pistacia integerrima]|uniref:Uncharacterized protein n=1 Tax=Pistacia integerrima TaxID=434235 RepID=A0ACC0XJ11_9ROSI|nr:hypothetical protein Pint_10853 [Pistacia integerrima]
MAKGYSRLLFFFSSIFTHLLVLSLAQPNFVIQSCSNDNGNYTTNSAYQTNLNSLLSSISSNNEIDYGFYNESSGQEPDKVNAIALCRGDVSLDVCRGCVKNATQKILQVCPNQKEAIGWYDECMLRYSNNSIFGEMEIQPSLELVSTQNVSSDVNAFNTGLQDLLRNLLLKNGSSHLKFQTGDTTASFQPIYALVQCTPDLSGVICSDCLDQAIAEIPSCCSGKIGGRVLTPSCNFRFEALPFL